MALEDPFIGVGWSFPPAFDAASRAVLMSEGLQDIQESLRIILGTALGERLMRPDFGANLEDQVFETMNSSMVSYVENLIRTAIIYHEARIDADRITVTPNQAEGRLDIAVSYSVRGSNSRFNFVFPFYLERG